MTVRVRFAPSPTGYLHVGGARTALFNWLFARHEGGEFRLRIENTDTSREVAEAVEQIEGTLAWLGLDVDGAVKFQLDRLQHAQEVARRLVDEGNAYEDEGAIRFRMPDEGTTGWDDVVLGGIEYPNEKLEDLVLVRSDGRPTYNFVSPLEDMLDGITHVIRGQDHVPNTPKQLRILDALGADVPVYAHVPLLNGPDGRKLSERLGLKPRDAFQPIRLALTGSPVSPGLFESLELLGKEESLARIGGSGRGGGSGAGARWKPRPWRRREMRGGGGRE